MTTVTELGYMRLGVSDLEAWKAYATLLGLEIEEEADSGRVYLRMDRWHHRIVLEQNDADDMLAAGLRLAGPQEFHEFKEKLSAQGIAFELASREECIDHKVLEFLTTTDPSGVPLEVFHGPRVDTHRPFHPARPMFGRWVTGAGGVGHVMLKSNNFQQSADFCRDVLGMRGGVEYRISRGDGPPVDLWFFHCNERDHTFSYGFPTEKYLQHLMLEVDNLDDVYYAYERVKGKYPIAIELGKHANDQVFSFYSVSPSGFQIEIGFGSDPAKHQSEFYVGDTYGHQFVPPAKREEAA